MTTTIQVGTLDLRNALTAVLPHAGTDADYPDLSRVRLTLSAKHVFALASDRYTAALALVSTWEYDGPEYEIVELVPDDAGKLLRVFKAPGKESGDSPQYMLRIEVDSDEITVTDCSGFDFGGHQLRLPRLDTAPTLGGAATLFARAHAGQIMLLDAATRMIVTGKNLARFNKAAATYDEPLMLETRSGETRQKAAVLIRCGEDFLGLIVPRPLDEDEAREAREWVEGWTARLPDLAAAAGGESG